MPWRLDFEGEVYREGDLTLDLIAKVERLLGDDRGWLKIQPVRFAQDAIAVLSIMVNDRKGDPVVEVVDRIGKLKPPEYLKVLKFEDDNDLPAEYREGFPPSADEPTTGT